MKKTEFHSIQSRIDAYRAGKLPEDEIDSLWVELIDDPEHLDYLVNSVNLEAIAANEKQKSNQTATSQSSGTPKETILYQMTRRWSRIAAVFLVGIGVLSTAYFWGSDYVVYESMPIADIELDSYRSSTIPTDVFDYQLQRAINLASMEQFEEAIAKIKEIEERNLSLEQHITLQVNKGSVFYNQEDYTSAKFVFNEILDQYGEEMHVLTEEQVHWFLGNTYLQMGNEELARVHIQKTYELNGAYRRLAERYLK